MKKIFSSLLALTLSLGGIAQTTTNIMSGVVFFDGYASVVSDPTPTGVIRFRNDLVTKQLTAQDLAAIGNELTINITISALCDNYDRIGNVSLALVPTGSTTYDPATVSRIEIGRFITPFMNKNVQPTSVPYSFEVNNIAKILKSADIASNFDFWLELEVFGVPYAANTQVSGCSGRNDVFEGKVDFVSNGPDAGFNPETYLQALSFKADFNNYQANATDAVGTTVKTINFTTTQTIYDAKFYLITSNHGANSGGEEYVRRVHNVEFDGAAVLTYTPGGKSCEPYRQYNTQGNGIYGSSVQSTSWWTSWNNWCPGDVIPIREISLGTLAAGSHSFKISVPAAQFSGQNGNFPLSLYLQGSNSEVLALEELNKTALHLFPNPANTVLNVQTDKEIQEFELLDASGKAVKRELTTPVNLSGIDTGIYFIQVRFADGMISRQRFIKQ
ncbi:peptide-N-glycosidase F-related protein [Fluviicola sp.]|uniref:peptide-N-glycosidase F-related protein n=1 Tax=Fluviicola sp. TaxID=1917219 RepID=UPI0031DEC717